jgi:hypothetical protein
MAGAELVGTFIALEYRDQLTGIGCHRLSLAYLVQSHTLVRC